MNKKNNIVKIITELERCYPEAVCSLIHNKPYELLIAARLSAQCTDNRVNMVTPKLFSKYPDLKSLACADIKDVEDIIKTCGLYKTKARDIVALSKTLIERFRGVLPQTIDELLTLPGVGRKTANLIMGDVYSKPAIVCDTHCIRISGRIGLVDSTNPLLVERQLRAILPPEKSSDFCHRLVIHGREVCKARNPQCNNCSIAKLCDYGQDVLK